MRPVIFCLAALAFLLPPSAIAQTPLTIRVEMSEFAFRPATIRLTAGRPVRLVLVNRGEIAHQFEAGYFRALPAVIVSDALHAEVTGFDFVRLNPGGTARLDFVPRSKGRYVFACTIEGHREAGMQGVLDVR